MSRRKRGGSRLAFLVVSLAVAIADESCAADPITLATAETPPAFAPDEPLADAFSLENAARYLDNAALAWQKSHACTACHTMLPYMMGRPALNALSPQSAEVREFFEQVVAG